ncbi:SctD/MshK family protein [Acetobacter cibinongensis]|uniref:Uncharacterized protein n=1 Tax=Acetobacter cibinongensis TaxID=146475 RepID=A0A1Z5YWP8_9PROT|nr:EscD/YscD/HrpQ family type III secretion system periplasmic domain-containing protein [Acetobacter cibinongensis]OUJ03595.1 hypothetical protein HK14_01295 [Acetobacter cibinongensis]
MQSRQTVTSSSLALLVIENGPQAGCSLALQKGVFSVGSSLDNDIIIADPTLDNTHFYIQDTLRGIKLTPQGGVILLPSGKRLDGKASYISRKNFSFSAGTTDFNVIVPPKTKIWPYGFSAALALLLIACVGLFSPLWARHHVPPVAVTPAAHPTAQQNRQTFQAALENKLTDAHLDTLSVSKTQDGALSVTGVLQKEQSKEWSFIKLWFDETYGTQTVLLDHTALMQAGTHSPIQIAGVALGAQPYVVDTSGQRLPPGSTVEDGWVIEKILPDRLLLHRGTEHLVVRY